MINSNKWKTVIVVLVVMAALPLLFGGYVYYSFVFSDNAFIVCVLMALQNCMESLLFNPLLPVHEIMANTDFIASTGLLERLIVILYCVVMVATPLIDVLIIFSVLDSALHLFVGFGFRKKNILVVGYNDAVRSLLVRKKKDSKIYLWTEELLSVEEERELYINRVSVRMNEYYLDDGLEENPKQYKRFDRFIRQKKITDILLLDKSDIKNMQYYMALSSCEICNERTIHFYVLSEESDVQTIIRDYFDNKLAGFFKTNSKNTDSHMDLRLFNYDQIQAESVFSKLPLFCGCETSQDKDVHLLIAGGNSLCAYIALHAMNQAVFSSENRIVIDIVDEKTDIIREILQRHFAKNLIENSNENTFELKPDRLDGFLRIRLTKYDLLKEDIDSILMNLQGDDNGGFTYAVLCSKNVNENLHIFHRIDSKKILSDGVSIPVTIRMLYSREIKEYLASFRWCKKIEFMGKNGEYIGLDQIINSEEENHIRDYNAIYATVTNEKVFAESSISGRQKKTDREILWNSLEYYKRQSNRALYHHRKVKEKTAPEAGDEMQRFWEQTVVDNEESRDLVWSRYLIADGKFPKLVELAKTEHRRWSYYFVSEGWGYSEKKEPKLRMHDCLVTWDCLKEKKLNTIIYDLVSSPLLLSDMNEH